MLQKYHVEILQQAIGDVFSPAALTNIIRANVYQDRVSAQLGHDKYHFDSNAFEKSYAYIEEQRGLVVSSLTKNDAPSAWSAFGRLTHTVQDFYAHSNYIDLWMASHPPGRTPPAAMIEPQDEALLKSPALHSGKINLPLELLATCPVVGSWIERIAPHRLARRHAPGLSRPM